MNILTRPWSVFSACASSDRFHTGIALCSSPHYSCASLSTEYNQSDLVSHSWCRLLGQEFDFWEMRSECLQPGAVRTRQSAVIGAVCAQKSLHLGQSRGFESHAKRRYARKSKCNLPLIHRRYSARGFISPLSNIHLDC